MADTRQVSNLANQEPITAAAALLARLQVINNNVSDHLDALQRVEGSVVGTPVSVSTEAKVASLSPVYQYGGFLGELDQAIANIERQLPQANSTIGRVKEAF